MGPPPGALPPMRMTASWLGPEVDLPNTSLWRQKMPQWRAPLGSRSYAKAPVAVHHRSACSGVKALRNTSVAKRQAAKLWLAFRSLDLFRALRESDHRRRDEERPFRSEQKTATNQNDYLTGKAPYKSCKPSVPPPISQNRVTRPLSPSGWRQPDRPNSAAYFSGSAHAPPQSG